MIRFSPDTTDTIAVVLVVVVLRTIVEVLVPRVVGIVLRTTPYSSNAASGFVGMQVFAPIFYNSLQKLWAAEKNQIRARSHTQFTNGIPAFCISDSRR